MLRYNYKDILVRLVKKRILEISLKHYWEYEKMWEKETMKRLFEKGLVRMGVEIYKQKTNGRIMQVNV